jgi:hypothetical protein
LKRVVIDLVERGGQVRTFHIEHATAQNVRDVIVRNVSRGSALQAKNQKVRTWVRLVAIVTLFAYESVTIDPD